MDTIILKTKDREETRLIQQLADKMGIDNKHLSEEEMDDIGMVILMSEVDRTQYVPEEVIMKKFRGDDVKIS